MDRNISIFINKYVKAIKNEYAAIFAGAGLSRSSGMVDWKALLKDTADELGLNIDDETDLISIAQYYKNEKGTRGELNQKLVDEFTKNTEMGENHNILASLPIKTYWTTNYDKLIEDAIKSCGKTPDVKIRNADLTINIPRKDAIVYKMHGDISSADEAVLIKEDYEDYNENRQVFTSALQGDLISKTFLFIGFSFDDPNLDYILSRVRILMGKNQRQHYCFFKKISRNDYKEEEKYLYAKIKQDLKIKDLKRFSIEALMVDDFKDITKILMIIKRKLDFKTVFISGAAEEYGTWGQSKSEDLVFNIAKALSNQDYKIVSGFGWGIGSSVINGTLSYIYSTNTRHLDDYLVMRPFPQNIKDENERKKLWKQYREDMLQNTGIALFLFGNKELNGNIIESDGVWQEFEIAHKNGAVIIPVGSTGYMAKKIWETVISSPDGYYPDDKQLRDYVEQLGTESDVGIIVDTIIKIIKLLEIIIYNT